MVAGRTAETRVVTATTTNASAAVTAAAGTFNEEDAGRPVSAASGIAGGTTILTVTSDTAVTLSANASATGARALTIGAATQAGSEYGFVGWSPETDLESESYSVAAVNAGTNVPPSNILNTYTPNTHRSRG